MWHLESLISKFDDLLKNEEFSNNEHLIKAKLNMRMIEKIRELSKIINDEKASTKLKNIAQQQLNVIAQTGKMSTNLTMPKSLSIEDISPAFENLQNKMAAGKNRLVEVKNQKEEAKKAAQKIAKEKQENRIKPLKMMNDKQLEAHLDQKSKLSNELNDRLGQGNLSNEEAKNIKEQLKDIEADLDAANNFKAEKQNARVKAMNLEFGGFENKKQQEAAIRRAGPQKEWQPPEPKTDENPLQRIARGIQSQKKHKVNEAIDFAHELFMNHETDHAHDIMSALPKEDLPEHLKDFNPSYMHHEISPKLWSALNDSHKKELMAAYNPIIKGKPKPDHLNDYHPMYAAYGITPTMWKNLPNDHKASVKSFHNDLISGKYENDPQYTALNKIKNHYRQPKATTPVTEETSPTKTASEKPTS